MKLSVCLIVNNEEQVLTRSLSCASKIVDELIVVDTGLTDRSVKIAKQFTDKVILVLCNSGTVPLLRNCAKMRRMHLHMQGGGRRRSGATSIDDNATDEGCRKQIAQAVDEQFLSSLFA